SFVLIDSETGVGNGQIFPAGPLREEARKGLARADAIVLVENTSTAKAEKIQLPMELTTPPIIANIVIDETTVPDGPVFAFAGIGRPEKFFEGLRSIGREPIQTKGFPDHHPYTSTEIANLKRSAYQRGAILVTTEKDFSRLTDESKDGIAQVRARMVFTPQNALESAILRLLDTK
ncbi:MAG: tetraacyldisaccharide 4'-kinase, partial [Pseudomonadota bacterium]